MLEEKQNWKHVYFHNFYIICIILSLFNPHGSGVFSEFDADKSAAFHLLLEDCTAHTHVHLFIQWILVRVRWVHAEARMHSNIIYNTAALWPDGRSIYIVIDIAHTHNTHTHTHARTHACTHTHTHTHKTHTHARTHAHTHTQNTHAHTKHTQHTHNTQHTHTHTHTMHNTHTHTHKTYTAHTQHTQHMHNTHTHKTHTAHTQYIHTTHTTHAHAHAHTHTHNAQHTTHRCSQYTWRIHNKWHVNNIRCHFIEMSWCIMKLHLDIVNQNIYKGCVIVWRTHWKCSCLLRTQSADRKSKTIAHVVNWAGPQLSNGLLW